MKKYDLQTKLKSSNVIRIKILNGTQHIFRVRGRAIGKGIDFLDIGIKNGINFHNFGIRNGNDFQDLGIKYKVGYTFFEKLI